MKGRRGNNERCMVKEGQERKGRKVEGEGEAEAGSPC